MIEFIGDGRVLATYSRTSDQLPVEININVTGVDVLRINYKVSATTSNGDYFFAGTIQ